jgi:hypothetical protein
MSCRGTTDQDQGPLIILWNFVADEEAAKRKKNRRGTVDPRNQFASTKFIYRICYGLGEAKKIGNKACSIGRRT